MSRLQKEMATAAPVRPCADKSAISWRRRSTCAISSMVGGSSLHALYSGVRPVRAGRQGAGFATTNHSRAHPLLVSRSSKLG